MRHSNSYLLFVALLAVDGSIIASPVNLGVADYHELITTTVLDPNLVYFQGPSQESFEKGKVALSYNFTDPVFSNEYAITQATAQAEGGNQPFVKVSAQTTGSIYVATTARATVRYSIVAKPLFPDAPALAYVNYSASGSFSQTPRLDTGAQFDSTLYLNNQLVGGLFGFADAIFDDFWSDSELKFSLLANAEIPIMIEASVVTGSYGTISAEVDPLFELAPESQPYFTLEFSPGLEDSDPTIITPEPATAFVVDGLICLAGLAKLLRRAVMPKPW
jgi:hypothetical protein